ncbi:efflux RND transporter periplasmic adaptor subunit [Lacrimispora sp.]|uniref:efflux RND transporter periplasmic adaptor subunit n=1 Tax=Lacrimispora sp. TaxID=2719234 RepID=UPI0039920E78
MNIFERKGKESHGMLEAEALAEPMPDEVFDQELQNLMKEESSGNKKKKARKKWSKKRKIITIGVAAFFGLFLVFKVSGGGGGAMMVTVSPLKKGEVVEELSVSGPVQGTDSVEVVSNLHAEILELPVKEGDRVEKGQVLAVLDDKDVKKELDIAQNAYESAVSTYQDKQLEAENGYAKAKQDYETAKANYNRTLTLFQAGSASQVELETASNAMDDAKRQMSTYTLKDGRPVANESYALQIEKEAFEVEQKKEALTNTKVTSPIAGTVVRVNCKVGRFADKTDDDKPMFIINNLDVLEMKINVSEYSIGKVAIGQPVEISADILNGETVKGEVTSISPTGEEKGSGSTERVIPTTIRIIDQNSRLIAGITAKARIELNKAENVWVVPFSTVIQKPDGTMAIAAVEENKVKMIPVTTGVESDIETEIIPVEEGALKEGMQVIDTPSDLLRDGMAVVIAPSAQ